MSLRTVGRLCDKLALAVNTAKPTGSLLRLVKAQIRKYGVQHTILTLLVRHFRKQSNGLSYRLLVFYVHWHQIQLNEHEHGAEYTLWLVQPAKAG